MKNSTLRKRNISVIIYAVIAALLITSVIGIMISHVFKIYKEDSFENLHLETRQIKRDINLQFISDRENLITMANFASKLYEDGETFELLFRSFTEIGLFEDVRILTQDNTYYSKKGRGTSVLSFDEEKTKGTYVSGRVADQVNEGKEIVRSAVPVVTEDGETIAVLYGIIDLVKFEEHYVDSVDKLGADLFVIDQKTGEFIIDTKRDTFGSISEISQTSFNDGYDYETLVASIESGGSGFTSFDSIVNGKKLYAHYAPLEFAGWTIMVSQPESRVFANAQSTGKYMLFISVLLVVIMALYLLVVGLTERKGFKINTTASNIRKTLLEVNRDVDKNHDALKSIIAFSKARSAVFADSNGEEFKCISEKYKNEMLSDEKRKFLISRIFGYIAKKRGEYTTNIYQSKITANKKLLRVMPELYDFIKRNNIKSIHVVAVTHSSSNVSILAVINSRRDIVTELLREIAVCFAMAIYNSKHLSATESIAVTDALTGVANRMAYKQYVKEAGERDIENLKCVYIDVNELNYYNNKYGHAAGDQMLKFVASTFKKEFKDSHIFRMGGDEFLIFTEGIKRQIIDERIDRAIVLIEEMKYHVSVGIMKKNDELTIEEMVNEAEKKMYVEKARYYQEKEYSGSDKPSDDIKIVKTGSREVDAYLDVLKNHYHGVYYVSLVKDTASQILAPSDYFDSKGDNVKFSEVLKQYVLENVRPDFHRILLNFIQFDVIAGQIKSGETPKVSYIRKDGEKVLLSVWNVPADNTAEMNTIWTFEKMAKEN